MEVRDGAVVRAFFSENPAFDGDCELKEQLERYFSGERVEFRCKVLLNVSEFVARVLKEVKKIPYGNVATYGEIARKLGTSARAVGQALKRNPVPVIIPCHRVVARSGLGGYSAGVEVKRWLLELEGVRL